MVFFTNSLTRIPSFIIINTTQRRKVIFMIQKLYIFQGTGLNPYENLAIEKLLLEKVRPGECILYLWQNQNTVVIGRNQNAWAECRTSLLEAEGGHLARRLSGGGAVFHDIGNLNFTFLISTDDYDLDKQLQVIQTACSLCGIRAEKSGRNDLLAEGHKFSGNAFYHQGPHSYHHGTLLIDVDMEKLQRYLSPPKAKLEAKGVASVRSRVINLKELAPALTCNAMRGYMEKAFETVYGLPAEPIVLTDTDWSVIHQYAQTNESWEFLYGNRLAFSLSCEEKFPWGYVVLQFHAKSGTIQQVKVYTDAMDWSMAATLEQALTGCPFRLDAMERAVAAASVDRQAAQDLIGLLRKQDL